jgi:hypothetical protein
MAKSEIRKLQGLQNLLKVQRLVNDSLNKLKSLLWQVSDVKHRTLLTQVAADHAKADKNLEIVESFLEKTYLKIPVVGISEGIF